MNYMTPQQVAEWLGKEIRFRLILDCPSATWNEVVATYTELTGSDSLSLFATPADTIKAPCYLLVACDDYIEEQAVLTLNGVRPEGEPDMSAVLINDESGYGAIFGPFWGKSRRTLLGVFGDKEEAQKLLDAWDGPVV
jgi:hypothetical protein